MIILSFQEANGDHVAVVTIDHQPNRVLIHVMDREGSTYQTIDVRTDQLPNSHNTEFRRQLTAANSLAQIALVLLANRRVTVEIH